MQNRRIFSLTLNLPIVSPLKKNGYIYIYIYISLSLRDITTRLLLLTYKHFYYELFIKKKEKERPAATIIFVCSILF